MPVGDSVVLNGYTITLTNIDNSKCPASQTWTYTVKKTGTPINSISFWSLGLECIPPLTILDTKPHTDEDRDTVCLDPGHTGRPVVKWNISNGSVFMFGTFSITVAGCFLEEKRDVALHAGNYCFCGQITGPSCCPITTSTTTTTTTTTTKTTTSTTTSTTTTKTTTSTTTSTTTTKTTTSTTTSTTTTKTTTSTTTTRTTTSSTSTTCSTTKVPVRGIKQSEIQDYQQY